MISKHKLNHVAAGLVDRFVGRDNDHEGLWALGLIYNEARHPPDAMPGRVELDLLARRAQPDAPVCTQIARNFAEELRRALKKHGFATDVLAAATISIAFGLPPIPLSRGYTPAGKPFSCTLMLATKDGRSVARERWEHCAPQEEFGGSRRGSW